MRPETAINYYLMSWLRPEVQTSTNQPKRDPLDKGSFLDMVRQLKAANPYFDITDAEISTIADLFIRPIKFATGYPRNAREQIVTGTIYVTEASWRQTEWHIGAPYAIGRATTSIVIVGSTAGDDLNMAEVVVAERLVGQLLLRGLPIFVAEHRMLSPVFATTNYAADEQNSHDYGFAMRSMTIDYDSMR